jgi:hypothetical protein
LTPPAVALAIPFDGDGDGQRAFAPECHSALDVFDVAGRSHGIADEEGRDIADAFDCSPANASACRNFLR